MSVLALQGRYERLRSGLSRGNSSALLHSLVHPLAINLQGGCREPSDASPGMLPNCESRAWLGRKGGHGAFFPGIIVRTDHPEPVCHALHATVLSARLTLFYCGIATDAQSCVCCL